MSFDICLQSFKGGEAAPGDPQAARLTLEPYLAAAPARGYARIRTADGGADVYGLGGESLMFSHAGGEVIWQVIVDVARAADLVIMPAGCPVCVMREDMISGLPAELQDDAIVIRSGAELQHAIVRS